MERCVCLCIWHKQVVTVMHTDFCVCACMSMGINLHVHLHLMELY